MVEMVAREWHAWHWSYSLLGMMGRQWLDAIQGSLKDTSSRNWKDSVLKESLTYVDATITKGRNEAVKERLMIGRRC